LADVGGGVTVLLRR